MFDRGLINEVCKTCEIVARTSSEKLRTSMWRYDKNSKKPERTTPIVIILASRIIRLFRSYASRYCDNVLWTLVLIPAQSLYNQSTELCADSIESHPYLANVFAESTYQVEQNKEEAQVSSSPSYSRRGRCRLQRAWSDENGLHWYVLLIRSWEFGPWYVGWLSNSWHKMVSRVSGRTRRKWIWDTWHRWCDRIHSLALLDRVKFIPTLFSS